jgi:hypothetical protein
LYRITLHCIVWSVFTVVYPQTASQPTTTTSPSWSAFITITTPSLTSSVLTLEHNLTSSGGEVTVRCSGNPGMTSSNLYSLKLSRVLNTYPNATPASLVAQYHHQLQPQVRVYGGGVAVVVVGGGVVVVGVGDGGGGAESGGRVVCSTPTPTLPLRR